MEKALIGSGGFATQIKAHMQQYDMVCFVDDEYYLPNNKNIKPLSEFDVNKYEVLIAIGDPKVRAEMVNKLPKETKYFTFVDPDAQIIGNINDIEFGEGTMICSGVVVLNSKIGKHCHLNIHTVIGHDSIIGDFFTTAPGVKISGNSLIGNKVYFGTNSSVREKIKICDDVIIGLNSGVVKNIEEPGTYGGVPAKKIS